MMKRLSVPLADFENQDLDTVLELSGARFDVDCVNWPEAFPYAPLCGGRIARTQDALVVDFRVSGLDLRARNTEDNGRQWEDSCVEVFIQDPEDGNYYNFEINALGKVLACTGPDRHNRTPRPVEEMEDILRFSQVEGGPIEEEGIHTWRVGVVIPFYLIGIDPENLPGSIRANFYKCGDKTAHPHYLSWSPVETLRPDFHRPEFFGELILG
ncbi:MAG: hypothetical protein II824_04280 [Bacteroidales bacterium]|nr:hypothetical protein [Bacteroidales bacterium]